MTRYLVETHISKINGEVVCRVYALLPDDPPKVYSIFGLRPHAGATPSEMEVLSVGFTDLPTAEQTEVDPFVKTTQRGS